MFIIEESVKFFDEALFNKGDIFEVTIEGVTRAVIVGECKKDLLKGNETCNNIIGYRPCSIKPEEVETITRLYENV